MDFNLSPADTEWRDRVKAFMDCEVRLRKAGVDIRRVIDRPEKEGLVIADPDGLLLEFYRRRGRVQGFSELDVLPYLS